MRVMRSLRRFSFLLATSSLFLALSAPLALSHGDVYFSFAPDAWASKRLTVSASETPYQLFEPSSDFVLTGYDLWVDNTGEAGPLTLLLADSEGSTLATNSITLPELPAIPGGNKLHINLATEKTLRAGEQYSLKIESALLGFGIYYADRITFLGHNQEFTTEYINGIARLGNTQQPFTFKFSLRTTEGGGSGADSGDDETPDTDVNAPPAQQYIAISNARVVSVTDTTATFAWTTDLASDSRVSIRSQLNPLYVINTGYDATLELEHTVVVTGLLPSVNYFADVFSSNGSELVLTTYTIGFQTLAAAAQPVTPDPVPAPVTPPPTAPTTPPAATTPPTTNPTTDTGSGQTNTTNPGSDSGSPSPIAGTGLEITEGSSADQTSVSWDAPAGSESIDGYRIDIFDYQHNLERRIKVPAGTLAKEVPKLSAGMHHVIVYAENDGVFTKVAPAASFLLQSENTVMLWKIVGLVVLWVVTLGGYYRYKFKKEKMVLPPEEGYDPNRQ